MSFILKYNDFLKWCGPDISEVFYNRKVNANWCCSLPFPYQHMFELPSGRVSHGCLNK